LSLGCYISKFRRIFWPTSSGSEVQGDDRTVRRITIIKQ